MFKRALLQDEDSLALSVLEGKGVSISLAQSGVAALRMLAEEPFDLVVCEELEVLRRARTLYPEAVVVMVGSKAQAVEAIQLGAFDYLVRPFSPDMLEEVFERAEALTLLQKAAPREGIEATIAKSPLMKQVLTDIAKVAKSSSSVFVSGESGTGKEVIAHAIHYQSLRSAQPFIKVNCAAIPEPLLESEFFGHEKGSFTGADARRLGRFELAHKGTLLLDEVSEISLAVQPKLLRAVQEQEFERVGGTKSIRVDVRLISTSNRNMKETVDNKLFREDLYYRLNVVPIRLPPLRDRREDIVSLADYFLTQMCAENQKKKKELSDEAKKRLLDYHWPGNIRELANVLERTVVMDLGDIVEPDHLRLEISCPVVATPACFVGLTLAEVEKRHILDTLQVHNHNKTQAAKALGISIRTLRNKLSLYKKIESPDLFGYTL